MNSELKELQKIAKMLCELNARIDALTQVVAITSRRETILKGKTKKGQIETLAGLGLSREIIAFIVGTTPGTVSARVSEMKKRKKRKESGRQEGGKL